MGVWLALFFVVGFISGGVFAFIVWCKDGLSKL